MSEQNKLSKVKTYHFDARFTTQEQVIQFLKTQPEGTAHPFQNNLFYNTSDHVDRIDMTKLSPKLFLDAGNRQGVEGSIAKALQTYSQLADMRDYNIEFLNSNSAVSFSDLSLNNSYSANKDARFCAASS